MVDDFFEKNIISQMDKMFRLSLSVLKNREDAEDSVSEIMMKLWSIKNDLVAKSNVMGYVYRVTQNHCIDKLRKRKKIILLKEATLRGETKSSLMGYDKKKEQSEAIDAILNQLPEKQKLIIHLRMVEGYEIDEIAKMLDEKKNTIEVYLSRARKNFRKLYEGNNNQ